MDLSQIKADKTVDARSMACPGPLLEAKKGIAGVAVGKVTPITRYAPDVVVQVIVCAVTVPLFLMRSISFWPSVGVPEGAAMVKVPVAMTSYWSELSPVGVTVPVVVTVPTRGVTRLFVNVSVVARPTSV